jgi:hypothetical protein
MVEIMKVALIFYLICLPLLQERLYKSLAQPFLGLFLEIKGIIIKMTDDPEKGAPRASDAYKIKRVPRDASLKPLTLVGTAVCKAYSGNEPASQVQTSSLRDAVCP